MEQEIWKPVVGYEGLYEVSNFGRVKRLNVKFQRRGGDIVSTKERILKQRLHNGYPTVQLSKQSIHKPKSVHRLIAKSFIPNPENKPHINHIDGSRDNNTISNLEWCTNKENIQHASTIGRIKKGVDTFMAKLTPEKVIQILNEPPTAKKTHLAKKYGVSDNLIGLVISRKIWKHVKHI